MVLQLYVFGTLDFDDFVFILVFLFDSFISILKVINFFMCFIGT